MTAMTTMTMIHVVLMPRCFAVRRLGET